VGVTALHAAGAHEAIANGQSRSDITPAMIDEMNAMWAREHANVTTVEALALHKKNAVSAAALIHSLSGAQLDRTGTALARMPSMTTQQVIRLRHCSVRAAGRDDGQSSRPTPTNRQGRRLRLLSFRDEHRQGAMRTCTELMNQRKCERLDTPTSFSFDVSAPNVPI
jgi:hypothetical protein